MKVCFNGTFGDGIDFLVNPFLNCFQFGQCVFETLRTYDEVRVFAVDEHLERLMRSAQILGMKREERREKKEGRKKKEEESRGTKEEIKRCLLELVRLNQISGKDLRVKIFLTPDFYWIRTMELEVMPIEFYKKGVAVNDTIFERNFPQAKYPNPAYHYLVKNRPDHCWDTLCFSPDGFLREGAISNIFAVINGILVTPKKGVLMGVTRQKVLAVAQNLNFKIEEREIHRDKLKSASEIFLTCTSKEIIPVCKWTNWENNNFDLSFKLKANFLRVR